jgi:non-heme chloroperoxidase
VELPDSGVGRRGLRCITYDRRGHGRSDCPSTGYDLDTLADDLASVVEQHELQGITLVGHSIGCREIVRYLSRHGDARVARAVFVGTNTPRRTRTSISHACRLLTLA